MPNFVPGGGSALSFLGAEFELIGTPGSSGRLSEIAYSPSLDLFATISESGTGAWAGNRVATSPSADSNTWTLRALANGSWQSIAWSPVLGLFAAVRADVGGSQVATSPDGITWTLRTTPAQTVTLRRIKWGGDKFVCVGQTASDASQNLGFYSTDGVTWNNIAAATNSQWHDVAYSPTLGRWVAVATTGAGARVMQSSNGISWTAVTGLTARTWFAVEWIPEQGVFLIVNGDGSNKALWSDNALTWTEIDIASPAVANVYYGLAWSPLFERYCMVAQTGPGTNRIGIGVSATADDQTTLQDAPSVSQYRRVNWIAEKGFWIAGGTEVSGSAIIRSCARFRVD